MAVLQAAVLENFWPLSALSFLLLLTVVTFSIFITYGYLLVTNVCRSYLEGTRLPIAKNWYFSWKRMGKFLSVMGWVSLAVGIPLLV